VYAYEGVALRTFRAARDCGIKCIYELPSGYWYYESELLREEADRRPEYAGTIMKLQDPRSELTEKDEEIQLADHLFVPSAYVKKSLSRLSLSPEKIHVIPYGANTPPCGSRQTHNGKLRVIFVGGLTQRKGIGYLLDAVRTMRSAVSLTLIGRKVGRCEEIDRAVAEHIWYPTLSHHRVLETVAQHDVLVLPSLTEGFGLVISEALSRGVPVITTANSGGPELITHGKDGFIVPIQSSEAIARCLEQLAQNRDRSEEMSRSALSKARQINWNIYQEKLILTLTRVLQNA
jgi:glycosyltransferase involved in cell wall biosynthesis